MQLICLLMEFDNQCWPAHKQAHTVTDCVLCQTPCSWDPALFACVCVMPPTMLLIVPCRPLPRTPIQMYRGLLVSMVG